MAKIDVEFPHQKTDSEIEALISDLQTDVLEKYGLKGAWKGSKFEVEGKGVKGQIESRNQTIYVSLKLGLLVSPFKDKIKNKLDEKLKQYLG